MQARRRERCPALPHFQSRARGVGSNPSAEEEDPAATVRRAGMDSTHHQRPDAVAERLQISRDPVRAAASKARHVLSDDPMRSALTDDARHLGPEPSAGAREPGATAGQARILAREAAGDEKGAQDARMHAADVVMHGNGGKVPGEDAAAEWIGFAERDRLKSRPRKSQAETADAAEKVKD